MQPGKQVTKWEVFISMLYNLVKTRGVSNDVCLYANVFQGNNCSTWCKVIYYEYHDSYCLWVM